MDEDTAIKMLRSADAPSAASMAVAIANELDGLAAQVWAFGWSQGPRRAVAIVSQMGAALAVGAVTLYSAEQWYAGAALVRQLIEVEYLLFLFASDAAEPERWLQASESEAKKIFSPTEMRKRAGDRFRSEEYSRHCDVGGHPRVGGHILLKEHLTLVSKSPREFFDPSKLWVDLAQHLERLAVHYIAAVTLHSPTNVYPDRFARLLKLASDWRDPDPNVAYI